MAGNRPPETILSSAALKLTARGAKQGEYAKLGWQYAFGSIQATYFSGAKEGSDRFFNIKVPPSMVQWYCNELMNAAQPGPYSIPEGMEMKFTSGKGQDEKPAGSLIIGKDDEGLIWTAIAKEGFHRVKWYFTLPQGVRVQRLNGTELSKEEISSRRARSYAETLSQSAILTWGQKFDPEEGNAYNAGGGGGNTNKYSGNAGGDESMGDAVASSGW